VSHGQCTDVGETRTCYEIVLDPSNEPAMALEVRLDRAVYRQGMQTVSTVALVLLAFCGLLTLGISALLQAQIIRPMLKLTRHIEAIAAGSLWGDRVKVDRDDEIGKAGEGVNHLLERVDSAQRELQTLNEELEGRVSARTRELAEANEQLRRDFELRKRLERQLQVAQKLESLGIMAGGLAHDFNNFLSTIRGNVALAIELLSPDHPARKRLEVAKRGGERARQLTAQLLDLASGDGGSPAEVSVEAAYRDLLSDLELPLGIASVMDFPPHLPDVLCDRRQLQQVLHNLVQNAVQAMPDGGVVRAQAAFIGADRPLALANCPPGLLFVRITISDQGVGIPEDGLTRIFDPYMTTKKAGTGLGLTLCWTIVRRHGGVLTVESTVGVGTSFHVFLPAAA
jgi:signal transduction histidine kinase